MQLDIYYFLLMLVTIKKKTFFTSFQPYYHEYIKFYFLIIFTIKFLNYSTYQCILQIITEKKNKVIFL